MTNTVIVGGSVAGFSVAAGLRDAGYTGGVTIIDPHHTALDRPPLSTEFLTDDDVKLELAPRQWFAAHNVTWVQDTVLSIRAAQDATDVPDAANAITVATATQEFNADHVVIATGAVAKSLALDRPVYTLRTLADAEALREVLRPGLRVAIAGGGLLAPELATSAKALGAEVTVFAPQIPAVEIFGKLAETLYRAMSGQVTVVERRLTAEEPLDDFDVVIAAVGVEPNVAVARDTGVRIDDGILVDANYRTAVDGIYAIGDVCRMHDQPRQDHWDHGRASAARVVHTIMGTDPDEPTPPWVWSDQFGHDAQAIGRVIPHNHEQLISRGDHVIFIVDGDRLVGAAALDDQQVIRAATRIITRGISVDPAQLADAEIPLRRLTRSGPVAAD